MTRLETSTDQETSVSITQAIHAKAVELGKHAVRMTTEAGSGHPSTALALSHIIAELIQRHPGIPRQPILGEIEFGDHVGRVS